MRGSDGLVLAADSRVTSAQGTADISQKFLQVNRDTGVMTYGLSAVGYIGIIALADRVASDRTNFPYFVPIRDIGQDVFSGCYQGWCSQNAWYQGYPADVSFILGGYDHVETNQFRVVHFTSPGFDPVENDRPYLVAAQWHVAEMLASKLYYPGITVDRVVDLAVFLLSATMTACPTVGGPMQIATVTTAQGFRGIHQDEIAQRMDRCQHLFTGVRVLLQELVAT